MEIRECSAKSWNKARKTTSIIKIGLKNATTSAGRTKTVSVLRSKIQ